MGTQILSPLLSIRAFFFCPDCTMRAVLPIIVNQLNFSSKDNLFVLSLALSINLYGNFMNFSLFAKTSLLCWIIYYVYGPRSRNVCTLT